MMSLLRGQIPTWMLHGAFHLETVQMNQNNNHDSKAENYGPAIKGGKKTPTAPIVAVAAPPWLELLTTLMSEK